jgi:hypothetical protein
MVNAIDSRCHSLLVGIVDDPSEADDAGAYKTALEPQLDRNNNVGGYSTENPSVMIKSRHFIRQDSLYATRVLEPCLWHATDLAAPVEVTSVKAAIKDAQQIVMFFKYRYKPKGVFRLKRKKWNIDHRALDGSRAKHVPTLKVQILLIFDFPCFA